MFDPFLKFKINRSVKVLLVVIKLTKLKHDKWMYGLIKNPYNEDVFNKDSLLTPSWEKEHFIGCYPVFIFLCRANDTRLFIFNGIKILGQYCKEILHKGPS